ncbi:MAG: hypothetical protein HKN47_15635 [Pirellulaceae bacterium]|nr:hypothetical protein [Pirellulaceae bacterium]
MSGSGRDFTTTTSQTIDGVDPSQWQDALEKVRVGELTPQAATAWLLADRSAGANVSSDASDSQVMAVAWDDDGEPVDSLLARLGTPPDDIIAAWCQQLAAASVIHQREWQLPLPEIDLSHWKVTAEGELLFGGYVFRVSEGETCPQVDRDSSNNIDRFRYRLSQGIDHDACPFESAASPISQTKLSQAKTHPRAKKATTKRAAENAPMRRLAMRGLLAIGAVAIVAILFHASQPGQDDRSSMDQGPGSANSIETGTRRDGLADASVTAQSAPDRSESDLNLSGDQNLSGDFLLLDSNDSAESDSTPRLSVLPEPMMSIGSLVPDLGLTDAEVDPAQQQKDSKDESAKSEAVEATAAEMNDVASLIEGADPLQDDEAPTPVESPQPTRVADVASVSLPPPGDVDTNVDLLVGDTTSLQLQFPFDVALALKQDPEGAGLWQIVDTRSQSTVANVGSEDQGFRWAERSQQTASSSALLHGRLVDDAGNTVYLRPRVESEPWKIDLSQWDTRPTWDLQGPIPPRIARLAVDFDLPEEVEVGWIEPIEATSLRRTRGVAVLTLQDDDSVSLGIRLDVRCSRKLSIRVRYAARLDAQSPWQNVSRPMLDQLSDQVVLQQEITSRQIVQMNHVYASADTDRRRSLRPVRDALEARGKSLLLVAQRMSTLAQLIARVESEASLQLKVSVDWSDGEQILLETKSDARG